MGVCAGGAAGRSVALRELRVCAGSPPPNSAFNRDRCYRGFLPPLPRAGQCLTNGYKGSVTFKGGVIFGHFGPTRTVPGASNIAYLYSAIRGPSGDPAQTYLNNAQSSGVVWAPGASKNLNIAPSVGAVIEDTITPSGPSASNFQ